MLSNHQLFKYLGNRNKNVLLQCIRILCRRLGRRFKFRIEQGKIFDLITLICLGLKSTRN